MIAGKIRPPAMAENVEKTKLYYGEDSANKKCQVYQEAAQFVRVFYCG